MTGKPEPASEWVGYCCTQMLASSTLVCDRHQDCPEDCPDVLVWHSEQHGPGLPIRDGGSSFLAIWFCPWCGADLREQGPVSTAEVYAWHVGRFGEPDRSLVALKLAEETGEVCGAVVKRAEGAVRPEKGLTTWAEWTAHLHDEMGDVAIVLNVLAGREGTTVDELLARRFRDDVSKRPCQEAPRGTS